MGDGKTTAEHIDAEADALFDETANVVSFRRNRRKKVSKIDGGEKDRSERARKTRSAKTLGGKKGSTATTGGKANGKKTRVTLRRAGAKKTKSKDKRNRRDQRRDEQRYVHDRRCRWMSRSSRQLIMWVHT